MGATTVVDEGTCPPGTTNSANLFMQVVVHPDGTITRPFVPTVPASDNAAAARKAAVSRDVPLDAELGTFLRVYLPNPVPPSSSRLPVLLFFHGGGFVMFSADSAPYHASCEAMAAALPAVVVSLDYRRAPEHRLPAAYDDAVAAILWLRNGAVKDPWIAAHGDLSRCFVMGSSSGGNMVLYAGIDTAILDLSPATVRGLILHQPYFGGVERTPSELRMEDDFMVPLEANDKLSALSLPVGADRDHRFSNPMKSLPPEAATGLPRCLVTANAGDPLIDRQRDFVRWIKEQGVEVVDKTDGEGFHAAELFVPEKAEELFAAVREFVYNAGPPAAAIET